MLYGLKEAVAMLIEEGLPAVFARHQRLAAATRAAARASGLAIQCQNEDEHSPVLTAVVMPEGHDADRFRQVVLENFNMSLGAGLGKVAGWVFRIGHLGEANELTVLAALAGVEMGLKLCQIPNGGSGIDAAMAAFLASR